MRGIASGRLYSHRVILNQLRADANKTASAMVDGADSLRSTAVSISRMSVLVGTVAVAALAVAVVALLYAANMKGAQ